MRSQTGEQSHFRQQQDIVMHQFVVKNELFDINIFFTVINGIPFYRSSGKNSGQPGTWFPFLGIKESTGWLIKPKAVLPENLIHFCRQININDEVLLHRFGNIKTWCMSASIGGGFWEKAEGKQLQQHLLTHYPQYFLQPLQVEKIQSALADKKIPTLSEWNVINNVLRQAGAIMTLNSMNSRLPYDEEMEFFNNPHNTDKVNRALSMMLIKDHVIDKKAYEAICLLSESDELMDYVLDNYLLEDASQCHAFLKLMDHKKQDVTKADLIAINQLNEYLLFNYKNDLSGNPVFRQAARIIYKESGEITHEEVELLHQLMTHHLLEYSMKLLGIKEPRLALESLVSTEAITKENIILISALHHLSLLDKHTHYLLTDEAARSALNRLLRADDLNRANVELIFELNNEDLLDKSQRLLKHESTRAALKVLYEEHALERINIRILRKLHEQALLDDKTTALLGHQAGRNALRQLFKKNSLDEENLALLDAYKQEKSVHKPN